MAIVYQRNRSYSLTVGDIKSNEGWLIENNLNIRFDVTKTTSNKDRSNQAIVELYNLSREKQKWLEQDYIGVVLSAGYLDTTVKRLFSGQATEVTTRKSGTDIITQIQLGDSYKELNHKTVNKLVEPGKSIQDVIEEIAKEIPGVSRTVFNGLNIKSQVIDGYPLSGTVRQQLDEISKAHNIDYHIDDGVLSVYDADGTSTDDLTTAFVISKDTGMIELPYATSGDTRKSKKDKKKKPRVTVKILLNPEIVPGSIVKIEDVNFGGYYKVVEVRSYGEYRGNDWASELLLEVKVKV